MGCIDLQWWWWWWCRYLSTPSADASRKYTSSDTTERMNTQKTCEFVSYFRLAVIFSSQLQFYAYEANPELYILPIFCQPESDPRSVRLPSFLPANQNILSQNIFWIANQNILLQKYFLSSNNICWWVLLPASRNIFSKFCLSANSNIWWWILLLVKFSSNLSKICFCVPTAIFGVEPKYPPTHFL